MINLKNGDCLELLKTIPDNSVDMILTDPPYGTTSCKWDVVIPFEPMWEQLNRVIKDNGAILLFASEPFASALRMSNIKNYKYDWIWLKDKGGNVGSSHKMPLKRHELICVFYKKPPFYEYKGEPLEKPYTHALSIKTTLNHLSKNTLKNNLTKDGKRIYRTYTHKTKDNVLYFAKERNNVHPTQKPVALLEYLINTYTKEQETVLDFTMGSGSTGVACVNTNRSFVGFELDENYFNIAKKRIYND